MSDDSTLIDDVRTLLETAVGDFDDAATRARLETALDGVDDPLRIAIAGRVKAGKSTLLNALVGERVAATDAAECTRYVTFYETGVSYRAWIQRPDGSEEQTGYSRTTGAVDVDGHDPASIDRLRVEFPSQHLDGLSLVDTPGLSSLTYDASQRTASFLSADQKDIEADAVIYLMRHLHRDDRGFLEAFGDPSFLSASAANAIALLSRADEVGGGRTDAIDIAARVARDYENEPGVRSHVSVVRPVAGLLGHSASTLEQHEYDAMSRIAAEPFDIVEVALLGVDQLLAAEIDDPSPEVRRALLDRFGLYGVRVGVGLIQHGLAPNATALADALRDRSGLPELRSLFVELFGERRRILRARSAVRLVQAALAANSGNHDDVRREVDRVLTNAHELAEFALLERMRLAGQAGPDALALPPARREEVEAIIGARGLSPHRRLGLPEDADDDEVRSTAIAAHERWRAIQDSPMTDPAVGEVARTAIRSLESCLARLT